MSKYRVLILRFLVAGLTLLAAQGSLSAQTIPETQRLYSFIDEVIYNSWGIYYDIGPGETTKDKWPDYSDESLARLNVLFQNALATLQSDYNYDALDYQGKLTYEIFDRYAKQEMLAPLTIGAGTMPKGKEYYRMMLNYRTSTDLTPNQIHKLGRQNVRRISGEMKQIMKQVNFPSNNLRDFFTFFRTDQRFFYKNTNNGRNKYLKQANRYLDKMWEKTDEMLTHGPLPLYLLEDVMEDWSISVLSGMTLHARPPLKIPPSEVPQWVIELRRIKKVDWK
jgi:uncharacterized protein (DUF885 family)